MQGTSINLCRFATSDAVTISIKYDNAAARRKVVLRGRPGLITACHAYDVTHVLVACCRLMQYLYCFQGLAAIRMCSLNELQAKDEMIDNN